MALSLGAGLALLSALFFGVSTPLAKLLLRDIDPWMLAGLLYLGSGLGLLALNGGRRVLGAADREASLRGRDWPWLGLAIVTGGVAGPVLLMVGLARTEGTTGALLLNLEGVFTALLAWFVFHENFDRRIALGMLAIVGGGAVVSWERGVSASGLGGPAAIGAACLAWAVDNNLTRKVSLTDPVQIALYKGCAAGAVNVVIALSSGAMIPPAPLLVAAALVGCGGYGVSLVLFVLALRYLGAARTGAYFSLAPFFGGVTALFLLREPLTPRIVAGGLMMAMGVWLHLTERHGHVHAHEPLTHEHRHAHDEHHRHAHDGTEPAGEPHTHWHLHAPVEHSHPHFPDSHHRHSH